jgi:histidine triad (HIT) family protein
MDYQKFLPGNLTRLVTGLVFSKMSFLLPFKQLRETDLLIAFYHPQPSYPIHIILTPKDAIPTLSDLSTGDNKFLTELFDCVRSLVTELGLEEIGYRLIANGGPYQRFPQLHFHLVSGDELK